MTSQTTKINALIPQWVPRNQDGLIAGTTSIAEGKLKNTTILVTYRGVQDLPEQKVRLDVPVDSNSNLSVSCKDVPESEQVPCRAAGI